ncbi:uncharacterized protein LOC110734578 [Chenopodium quinoa]|uniref:uncharacterized protein LOC110734578 n=1 Tax=Chenopodium quinoa TaxID=63459 RepID=UPI000B778B37|nr:uncharacterized protein LOC110734578 [Chenopodium quinoa]
MDEKWFYLNPNKRRFYLLPSEEDPYMAIQSKRFKLKAMFMALIGKPLYDTNGELLHDGKYGIFPFTVKQLAKKSSKHRDAGTWETKAIQNVNKEVIRDMLPTNVIPAIISKWPESLAKNVVIQWDNARPHQVPKDAEFMTTTTAHGFNIQFVYQPAQSPDFNVLDLGLFRSMQSLQYQSFPSNLDELVTKVMDSYGTFNPQVNKYIWLTLQKCMIKILKAEGGNKNGKETDVMWSLNPSKDLYVIVEYNTKSQCYLNNNSIKPIVGAKHLCVVKFNGVPSSYGFG